MIYSFIWSVKAFEVLSLSHNKVTQINIQNKMKCHLKRDTLKMIKDYQIEHNRIEYIDKTSSQ